MPEPSQFGRRLKRFRERAGLSQGELARRAGITRVSISRVESGVIEALSLKGIVNCADALGVSIDQLVRDPLDEDSDEARSRMATAHI